MEVQMPLNTVCILLFVRHHSLDLLMRRTTKKKKCNFTDHVALVRFSNSNKTAEITRHHYALLWLFIAVVSLIHHMLTIIAVISQSLLNVRRMINDSFINSILKQTVHSASQFRIKWKYHKQGNDGSNVNKENDKFITHKWFRLSL